MQLLGSFNGGPSQGSLLLAVVVAIVIGAVAGKHCASKVQAFLYAFLGSIATCSLCVFLGNQQGDMAGMVLYGALVILCPALGLLSGVLAVVIRWIVSRW